MVIELAPRLGIAAGVVDAAAPRRALVARLMRHVGLGTDDGLNSLLLTLTVEVEDPVHVAVIGNAECGLTIGHGCRNEFIKTRGAVEHRELGVNMEVGKRVGHSGVRTTKLPNPCDAGMKKTHCL